MRQALDILTKSNGNFISGRKESILVGINIYGFMLFFNACNYKLYKFYGI